MNDGVGPNCYTYVQGNGPPHSGSGISNAGFVVGAADGTLVPIATYVGWNYRKAEERDIGLPRS